MTNTASHAWVALTEHRQKLGTKHLRDLFADDPARTASLSLSFEDSLLFDFSKQRLTRETLNLLVDLAEASFVPEGIRRMFNGDRINVSETRAALHVALRRSSVPFPNARMDVMPEVLATRARMAGFAEQLRTGEAQGHHGTVIRDVVNIGIGGSDLGPKMVDYALRSLTHPTLSVHYVSNLDGAQMAPLLQTLDPRATLFIVVS
ncbi:MAG: glucose-6-phosphate isomerase, partial [Candidatus Accumulibacter sp.]|nr:glucose-6-phosphate isomerase [Accumulibacter sp.]